jgi:hypothetical protein
MRINLTRTTTRQHGGDEAGPDIHETWTVTDETTGKATKIVKRSHGYGGNFYLPDNPRGHVHVKDGKVTRTIYGVGTDIWAVASVEDIDMSPWAILALIRMSPAANITITTEHSASSYGQPVVIDNIEGGQISDIMTALLNKLPIQ